MTNQGSVTGKGGLEQTPLLQGLRLATIALVSAVVTAAVVIGIGQAWVDHAGHDTAAQGDSMPVQLIRNSG